MKTCKNCGKEVVESKEAYPPYIVWQHVDNDSPYCGGVEGRGMWGQVDE